MECASCGHANREGKRFCVECGAPVALRCPGCAAEVEPGEKFCGECGTALTAGPAPAAPSPSAVRKTVTVLFADLGGSTGFGERTDPEITRQVLARYHALLQETIDAHGGTVAKFMGDGMMATFGIPEVAEDDAQRAVAAGAGLQARFEDFAADVERRRAETLTLRVGINTGEVVIGEADADLIGDALNVAARLEKACRPGHVLVGEETWRLTRGDVAYEALGEVTVAGRAQPVAIYEVATGSAAETEVAAPFVGREPEIDRLLAVLGDARAASAARLATVLGSPGVGKTRLSRELCARADAQSVELRCDRAGEATFAPVAQLLRESAGLADDADADNARTAIAALLPETVADRSRVIDVLAGLVGAAPSRSVEETFWAVRRLVEATAADRPLVVVIDDIQWAEPLLLDLIEHLAEWVGGAAVLLLGLARPELREVRPALAEPGRPVADVLVLDGLDPTATEALAAGLLGAERLPARLVDRLPASTDGNPLFVRELVRMLVDDRVIRRRDDGEWELTIDADAVDVPPTIQSLLGARVERLPGEEREVLELASVVGAEFSLGALHELVGDRVPVATRLESMRRKELVEPTGTYWGDEPVYRFHHVLIRDAAYRRLLKTTRADLHERVAEWTDRTATDLIGEHEAAIAFHYEQAYGYRSELGALDGRADELARRGAELLTAAAQRALGRDDLAAAGALTARALALLPASAAAARADLLLTGCECLLASGDGAAARPLVEELGRVAGGDDRLAAWADCFAAQLIGLTDPDGLVAADARAQAAAATLTELSDGSGQAKAHQVRAGLLARLGRVGDAEIELDLALAAARAADDRRRVTAVLGAAPDAALFGPSPVARAGGRCLDVVRLLRITTASPAVEAASNRCQAVLESLRGRFDVARSMLGSARAALEDLGLRHGLAQTDLYAGMVEMIAGDPHAAIPPLRSAFGGLGALGVGADAGNAAALLARALLVDGQVDAADEMATASEQMAGQNLKTAIGWRVARAEVLAARGDLVGAVMLAEQTVEIAAGTDLVVDHADACVALATLRARAGDEAGSRAARSDAKHLYDAKGATVPAARLDDVEVVAAAPAPAPAPARQPTATARVENVASRVYTQVMAVIAAGNDRELGNLIAPEFIHDDRRLAVNYGVAELSSSAAQVAWLREEGFLISAPRVVAVRGERQALTYNDTRTPTDFEISSLCLVEVDERERLVLLVQFDEGDLAAAQADLDQRYLAGEGAERADALRPLVEHLAAFHARDWDAVAESVDGYEIVDHRGLWPDGGPEVYVERMHSLVATAPDATIVARRLDVRGDAVLMAGEVHAIAAHGDRHQYEFQIVGRPGRIEYFDEHDFPAAMSRLEELGARAAPAVENEASRVHARMIDAIASGRDDELAELLAPEFRYDDRRTVVNMGDNDRAAAAAHLVQLREAGYEWRSPSTVAVRGERVALARSLFRTGAGDDSSSLVLVEIDEAGRLLSITQLDDDALADALAELEARYLAADGGGRPPLENTASRVDAEVIALFVGGDDRALADLVAPDFVYDDRRHVVNFGTTDATGAASYVGWLRDDGWEVAPPQVVAIRGDRLVLSRRSRRTPNGDDLTSLAVVEVDDRGRLLALVQFDEEALDDAVAELDRRYGAGEGAGQLVEDHDWGLRTLEIENEATRVASDLVTTAAVQPIAVRGERIAASRFTGLDDAGNETVRIGAIELDNSGQIVREVEFDDEDEVAVIDLLDEWYVAGEGAMHAEVLAAQRKGIQLFHSGDWSGLADHLAPEFAFVDHRPLPAPDSDAAGLVELMQARKGQTPDERSRVRKVYVQSRAIFSFGDVVGTDEHGGRLEWPTLTVTDLDASGRFLHLEYFAPEQLEEALARFDELGAGPGPTVATVENSASRLLVEAFGFVRAHDRDGLLALMAPGFEASSRRAITPGGNQSGDAFLDAAFGVLDVFAEAVIETTVATRGDRLALLRSRFSRDGFDVHMLLLVECDAPRALRAIVLFDDDDLARAVADLDERHIAGEGADHAFVIRRAGDIGRSMASPDGAATLALGHPALSFTDHRLLGVGTMDRDGLAGYLAARAEQTAEDASYFRDLTVRGNTMMGVLRSIGVSPDGVDVLYEFRCVARWVAGKVHDSHWYDIDDVDEARARFDALAIAPPPADLDNECVAECVRGEWLAAFGTIAEAVDAIAPDIVSVDHRGGTGKGFRIAGRDAYVENQIEMRTSITLSPRSEWLAVRGERHALAKYTWTTRNGFEIEHLGILQIDESGRVCRNDQYDVVDLDAAIAALDEWYGESEGAEHAETLAVITMGYAVMAGREYEVMRDGLRVGAAPDFVFVDHRHAGWGPLDVDGLVEMQRTYDDIDRSFLIQRIQFAETATLSSVHNRGVDPNGGEVEWVFHGVNRWNADGLITNIEMWDVADWDAALTRFDELAAEGVAEAPVRVPGPTNLAAERWIELIGCIVACDAEGIRARVSADFEGLDHRPTVAGPSSDATEFVAGALGAAEVFDDIAPEEVLAVRGERSVLLRGRFASDGFVVPLLTLNEVDVDGFATRTVVLDDADLAGAIGELDERYLAGEGAEHASFLRPFVEFWRCYNSRDWDRARSYLAEDTMFVDHGLLGAGTSVKTAEQLVEFVRGLVDLVPDIVAFESEYLAISGGWILSRHVTRGTSAEGADFATEYLTISGVRDGLATRIEAFDVDQLTDAYARFGELTAAGTTQNAATRQMARFCSLLTSGGLAATAEVLRADLTVVDHRWHGIAPSTHDPAAFLAHVRGTGSAGLTAASFDALAVRGQRYALARWTLRSPGGDTTSNLTVTEVDDDGRSIRGEVFDVGDLPRAVALLDAWYLEGEGAEHAWIGAPGAEFWSCYNARDWDGARRFLADEIVVVDHRALSSGSSLQTADQLIDYVEAMIDLVPDLVAFDIEHPRIGRRAALSRHVARGTSTEGAEVELETLVITEMQDGRFVRSETFAPDQFDEAVARFDAIEAEAAGS